MKSAVVTGSRVLLRPPSLRDLGEFVALNRASRRLHRGLASPPTEEEQFIAFLKKCRRADSACFLICRPEDRRIVGSINLSQIVRGGFQNAYLGYYMGERYAGQGYMTEAVQLIVRHAFEGLKLHRLEANIQPGNLASIVVVKRAGFTMEGYSRRYLKICGRWRDHERWAIVSEDYRVSAQNIRRRLIHPITRRRE